MSLTPHNPLIQDWIVRGLRWKYVWQPTYRPFTVPANGQVQLPRGEFIYRAPEGVVVTFGAVFDHAMCGIRMNNPQLDTLNIFTVNSMTFLGTYNQPWGIFTTVPPQTAPGIYTITNWKAWPWTDWCELYVINEDSSDHTCYGFAYTIALLLEERPPDATESALLAMLANSLYPVEDTLKNKLPKREVDNWISRLKLDKIYKPKEVKEET